MDIVAQLLLPAGLAFIMLTLGLALTVDDFRRVVVYPKAVLVGVLCQVLIIPAVAFLLAWIGGIAPPLAVGLVIVALRPGGVTSNLLTFLAKGDTALSVTMTALVSLMSGLTLPLVVNLGLVVFAGTGGMVPLAVTRMVLGVLAVTTVPLAVGMMACRFRPSFAKTVARPARQGAIAVFAAIVVATFVENWNHITDHLVDLGPMVFLLIVVAMVSAFAVSSAFSLERPQRTAIVVECCMQNAAVGIFVVTTYFDGTEMIVPSVLYALLMNITVFIFCISTIRKNTRFFS